MTLKETITTEMTAAMKSGDKVRLETVRSVRAGILEYEKSGKGEIEALNEEEIPKLITGHIDLVQIRNGQVHILDYKPNAAKEKPIEQLTLYALAL